MNDRISEPPHTQTLVDHDVYSTSLANQILALPPGWLVRSGNMIMLLGVVLFICFSFLISYPDKVLADIRLSTDRPPIDLIAKGSAEIENLWFNEGDIVEPGSIIAELRSTTSWSKVEEIEILLNNYTRPIDYVDLNIDSLLAQAHYGNLTDPVVVFLTEIKSFVDYLSRNLVGKRIHSLETEVYHLEQINNALDSQYAFKQQEIELEKQALNRSAELLRNGLISELEYEKSEFAYSAELRAIKTFEMSIISNLREVERLKGEIVQEEIRDMTEMSRISKAIYEHTYDLKSKLASWKYQHLIISPVHGHITYKLFIKEDTYLEQGAALGTIVPSTAGNKIIGSCLIPMGGIGQVTPGTEAHVELTSYPKHKYGIIKTNVVHISPLSTSMGEQGNWGDDVYVAELVFNDTLVTNRGFQIPFTQNISGSVKLITQEYRLIDRLIDRFRFVGNY